MQYDPRLRGLPPVLRPVRGREPFIPDDYDELVERSLAERRAQRLAALDPWFAEVTLPVPEVRTDTLSRRSPALPPAADAHRGPLAPVRRAWVAKYNPTRARRDRRIGASDPFHEFNWACPKGAITDSWIGTWPGVMRGAGRYAPAMGFGDLVFVMRTVAAPGDPAPLARRTLVGVWWVESTVDAPMQHAAGNGVRWVREVNSFPLRRFDFPVPVVATGQVDAAFGKVGALTDRSRCALLPLTDAEALVVARDCGLPASVLTEPDPDQLARHLAGLDLGPPQRVRRRIAEGARAHAHKRSVELAAVDVVLAACRRSRFGAVSTMAERGLGSDLWANAIEPDGCTTELRLEVKGLSGPSAWRANLTKAEHDAALKNVGGNDWWLAVVVNALRADRHDVWFSAEEATRIWHVQSGEGIYRADPGIGKAMLAARRANHGRISRHT